MRIINSDTMRKKMFRLFVCLLFGSISVKGQETSPDCEFYFNEAVFYLKGSEFVPRDSLKAIAYLEPCVEAAYSDAQLLMGRLYLNSTNPDNYKKGFSLLKKAAKQDNEKAACDLGILYKYGKGCQMNFDKSRKWFQTAAELGSSKAAYSLGYLSYKGLGTIEQDYTEAVQWFQKSDYPMAIHWLAQSCYFGYGMPQDQSMALQLLEKNKIKNSKTLLKCLKKSDGIKQNTQGISEIPTFLNELMSEEEEEEEEEILLEKIPFKAQKLSGTWVGHLVQFDWSGTQLAQTLPVVLQLQYNRAEETVHYQWKANKKKVEGEAICNGATLYFDTLKLKIPRLYVDDETQKTLKYRMLSGSFEFKKHKGVLYASAVLETFVPKWREPGPPMSLVLTKEKAGEEDELSEEELLGLSAQKDSFIQLYPNPFHDELLIAYTLETAGDVQISIAGFDGVFARQIKTEIAQASGKHCYHFDGSELQKGIYVVRIVVDGVAYTKLIVKKE